MLSEAAHAKGMFVAECFDPLGRRRWRDRFSNTVVTVGKNLALDTYLSGVGYSVAGPYLGLISSVGFAAISAADTMVVRSWNEAGGVNAPTYTAPRPIVTWSPTAAGTKTGVVSFAITGPGTIKGGFIVFGPGALATIDNLGGTLYSTGLFSGGDQAVINGDTLNVSYTASL